MFSIGLSYSLCVVSVVAFSRDFWASRTANHPVIHPGLVANPTPVDRLEQI